MNQNNGSQLNPQLTLSSPTTANPPATVTATSANGNGNDLNGNGRTATGNDKFDQPVILRQSAGWSRAILWTILGVTTFGIIWASVAKLEQAVPAQGKLEPQGTVKEVQSPVGGVVTEVHVEDGQQVKQGDVLLSLDSTAAQAQLTSLKKVRDALVKENQFYRSVMGSAVSTSEPSVLPASLPPEITSLAQSRKALVAENQLFRTQLIGGDGGNLNPEQRARLRFAQAELNSRVATNELEAGQLKRQLAQNEVQLENARSRLEVEGGILKDIEAVAKEGGIARIQFRKQEQEVKTRQAEVNQLFQEQERLRLDIAQAEQQLKNTVALSQKDVTTQMADNEKRLAEIDSQLNKLIVENEKKVAEIDSQLSQTQLTLKYQELRAPVSGTVFDLQPSAPGFVANTSEPILKIVPGDALIAKVYLTNRDIGFIREGMPVDVRIDSFPFSEFGDIKGELIWIGSDALPPDQIRPFYSFPARIRLDQQYLKVNQREILLQSGMSVSANIRVRDRTVLSIFTDLFIDKTESLKTVR